MEQNIQSISKEKFNFVQRNDLTHDKKLATKPRGYFADAFVRFCKNKGAVVGAIVIVFLLLFALIAPFCTPYTVDYYDTIFSLMEPRNEAFVNTNFWDGCKIKETGYLSFVEDYAIGLETGKGVIKNGEYTVDEETGSYTYRYDTYYGTGFGRYKIITLEEYNDIQRYQNETGRQVIYPTVKTADRPGKDDKSPHKVNANLYYKVTTDRTDTLQPVIENGSVVPNYWQYTGAENKPGLAAEYNSLRIEGENGITVGGEQVFYVYGKLMPGNTVEIRAFNYEYYRYYHTQVLKDGIGAPSFLFGTTSFGKDIFTCLASGARFSFIFAIVVAVVNLFVGAIYGAIAGYFGGKIDLFMERFSDILGAVPTMIVITLLKLHMGTSSQALVLFIAFFMTGWIGMAATTRMQFYRYKNQEYVLAARTLGASDARLMFKHIFPNAIGTLVTSCALVIPSMIYSETNLSYLGIINLEAGKITSVGTMIAAGQRDMMVAPFVAVFPSLFLALMMLSFNLFGNGLRDAFNPSLRGSE